MKDKERRDMRTDRRTQNLRSLAYGTVYRRRRSNRRVADDQVYIPDVHDRSACLAALALLVMSCLDALFTLNILRLGGEEVNVLMRNLLETSTFSFITIKYAATACGAVLLLIFSRVRIGGVLRVGLVLNALCVLYALLMIYHIFLTVIATSG